MNQHLVEASKPVCRPGQCYSQMIWEVEEELERRKAVIENKGLEISR